MSSNQGNILLIDDQPIYLNTVSKLLKDSGYTVFSSMSGEDGVVIAEEKLPDLIITDWEMPGMTGVEVIQSLKNNEFTQDIPVVMATGIMTDTENLQLAFDAGAIDYLRKPFEKTELLSRVQTALKNYAAYRDLKLKYKRLESNIKERESMLSLAAHDLKSPLKKVKGLMQLIPLVGELNEEQTSYVGMIDEVIMKGNHFIQEYLDLHSLESQPNVQKRDPIHPGKFFLSFLNGYKHAASQKSIELYIEIEGEEATFYGDEDYLFRIVDNLMSNAIKFSEPKKKVLLKVKSTLQELWFSITDEGPGISEEDQQKMFRKFQRLTARPTGGENSTGLGLSIIKTLLERLNGNISVDSKLSQGTTFIVTLPNNAS